MTSGVAFLHTAQVHVETFGALARQIDDSVPVQHRVREDLLASALALGVSSEVVRSAVSEALHDLVRDGASLVVCTCTTIAGLAEATVVPGCTVLRVDRPVAEEAVASGRRILLVAALPTALQQTLALLRQVASERGLAPQIVEAPCTSAWDLFERGDVSGYLAEVASLVEATAISGDLVLLAQASMARAAELVGRSDISILSSPEPCVKAALVTYRLR